MKKYLILLYLSLSALSFAQFKENAFETDQDKLDRQSTIANSSENNGTLGSTENTSNDLTGHEHEEGPGNPGEPVPLNGAIPVLLLSGLCIIVYFNRSRRINN